MPRSRPMEQRFWEKVRKGTDCWEWIGANTRGYGVFGRFNADGKWSTILAHRLSYEMASGRIPEGVIVCHHCDNPRCVRPEHLFLGTDKDNQVDKCAEGRNCRGERRSKGLTDGDVRLIRTLYAEGASQPSLALRFGVARTTINDIVNLYTWRHVEEDTPRHRRTDNRRQRAVLSEDQVRAIRQGASRGELQSDIGRRFGCSHSQISRIVLRLQWASVE